MKFFVCLHNISDCAELRKVEVLGTSLVRLSNYSLD